MNKLEKPLLKNWQVDELIMSRNDRLPSEGVDRKSMIELRSILKEVLATLYIQAIMTDKVRSLERFLDFWLINYKSYLLLNTEVLQGLSDTIFGDKDYVDWVMQLKSLFFSRSMLSTAEQADLILSVIQSINQDYDENTTMIPDAIIHRVNATDTDDIDGFLSFMAGNKWLLAPLLINLWLSVDVVLELRELGREYGALLYDDLKKEV